MHCPGLILYIVDENLLKKVQAAAMFILTTIDALQMKSSMNLSCETSIGADIQSLQ